MTMSTSIIKKAVGLMRRGLKDFFRLIDWINFMIRMNGKFKKKNYFVKY